MRSLNVIVVVGLLSGPAQAESVLESISTLKDAVQQQMAVEETLEKILDIQPSAHTEPQDATPRAETDTAPSSGFVPDQAVPTHFELIAKGPTAADEAYAEARKAEQDRDYALALEKVGQALAIEPKHEQARLAEGRVLVKAGEPEKAAELLNEVVQSGRSGWQAWYWLGTAYLLDREVDRAAAALDEALRRNGEVAEVWIHRALIEQQRDEHRTALQLLEIANELAPNHPLVLLNLAYSTEALGYQDAANRAYRRFLSRAHRGQVDNVTRFAIIRHLSDGEVVNSPSVGGAKAPSKGSTLDPQIQYPARLEPAS
ncbi:MAG: tetratricopeptide repeat protein [Pseudomonadota bacterium]